VGEPQAGAEEVEIYIALTGSDSERTVADWLGTLRLDPAELEQQARGRPRARDVAHLVPDVSVAVTRSLAEALIERAGIEGDGEGEWFRGDGRHTSAISEALTWALVAIAAD
jgi:hypothetical protein